MLHMPTPMLTSGPSGPSYEDFRAHISVLATGGEIGWQDYAVNFGTGNFRTTANNGTPGQMLGTSWLNRFRANATSTDRAMQHAYPTQAVYDEQIALGLEVYIEIGASGTGGVTGITRNGYSSGGGGSAANRNMYRYIRWDVALGKAFEGAPLFGTAEVEYDLPA